MALLSPSLTLAPKNNGLQRELDVLHRLQSSLSDGYQIFHSVTWHSLHEGTDRHGEIDIVVLGPTGNVLLVEVKSGHVEVENGVMMKLYKDGAHDVGRQTRIQYAAMVNRLGQAGLRAHVTNCLVLPDHRLGEQQVVAIPPERIVDASRFDFLGTYVREMLGAVHTNSDTESIRQFFSNEFNVTLDMNVLGDQVRKTTLKLADGLATWIPRIMAPSGVIRVQATAGSGKTQLALRLLQDAAFSGTRSLYVCFNRTLADHIGHIAPTRAKVASFHELCVEHYKQNIGEPNFTNHNSFENLIEQYCQDVENDEPDIATTMRSRYGLILIDEAQDFDAAWVQSLIAQLEVNGRLYILEDDSQRLYARDEFDLPEAIQINCQDNFRSPRSVCKAINALGLTAMSVQARGPYEGELPGFHTYDTTHACLYKTEMAVKTLIKRGIALNEIVVISWRGIAKSKLMQSDNIGTFKIRRFTGKYTDSGDALWTTGDLLVDSVYRYKGQSAAGVVLSEIDFDEFDDAAKRKLFVGLTRAQLAVEVVLSEQAAACLSSLI